MNQNDTNRWKCVNNQLVEQLVKATHRSPPEKWHHNGPRGLTRREYERLAAELEGQSGLTLLQHDFEGKFL